jgi:hypothetical protein
MRSTLPSDPGSLRISRRTLLKAGLAGGAALLLARCLYTPSSSRAPSASAGLESGARSILAALIPVMLEGALPRDADASARAEVLAAIEQEIAGLPPATREELAQLFSLLGFAPTRCVVAGVWSAWPDATEASIASFLNRWRDSRFPLLRSAYAALHQLILAAWYANPRAWPATGYAGPPSLEIGG